MYLPFTSSEQVIADLRAAAETDALWLLCIADSHGDDLPDLLAAFRTLGMKVCGGLFPGLIQGAATKDTGMIAIPLPAASQVALAKLAPGSVDWQTPPANVNENGQASAIILVDCLAPNIAGLLEDIYDRYGHRVSYVGAGAAYRDLRPAPTLFTEQGTQGHAALLITTREQATVRVRHGWKRVRGPFVASRTLGNIIREFNWESAGSFFRQEVVALNPEYAAHPVFPDLSTIYPLCIGKEGGEDVIRDPIQITEGGEIVVLSDVMENSVMYLAHGNRVSLIEAARQAVEDCGMPQDVARCFVSDCYSRTLMLGEAFPQELETVCRAVARFTDAVPEGVLAMGEIAANGEQSLEFYNKTFVVALTHRQAHESD
jgi:hypothetical protein